MCIRGKRVQHKSFQDDAGVRKANKPIQKNNSNKKKVNTERKDLGRTGATNQEDEKGNTGTLDRAVKGKQTESRR